MLVRTLLNDDEPLYKAELMAAVGRVQVRSQAVLQDKYRHMCAGFAGHVADITATLTQIVSPAAPAAASATAIELQTMCSVQLHTACIYIA